MSEIKQCTICIKCRVVEISWLVARCDEGLQRNRVTIVIGVENTTDRGLDRGAGKCRMATETHVG